MNGKFFAHLSPEIRDHQRLNLNENSELSALFAQSDAASRGLLDGYKGQDWPLLLRLSQQAEADQQLISTALDDEKGSDYAQICALLLALKRQALSWMMSGQLQGAQEQDFSARAKLWTGFADFSIDLALRAACSEPRLLRQYPQLAHCAAQQGEKQGFIPGLFVLGLGKLGGEDLNASSDVDLVAFFDPKTFFAQLDYGRTELSARLMRAMTKILMPQTIGQQVWRVDWRLRPDPSVTDLAMSTDAALDYFLFRAAPWRRLAMIKARVVAGDQKAGAAFLDELQPYLWRQTLDFRAKDDVHVIKQKIRADHPDLEPQRQGLVPLDRADLFHVKLGRGGIREIEFMVNALQMVWGGRIPELRCTNTLEALRILGQHDLLEQTSALHDAYIFLRKCENAIQLINDAHKHTIPDDSAQQELIAAMIGYSLKDFQEQLTHYRNTVHQPFENFFMDMVVDSVIAKGHKQEQQSAQEFGLEQKQKQEQEQPQDDGLFDAERLLKDWQASFERYGLPLQAQGALKALAQRCESLVRGACNPAGVAERLETFIRRLPAGGQYIRLLSEVPHLAHDVLLPYARGGEFALLLEQSPHVTDLLIERKGNTLLTRKDILTAGKRLYSLTHYEDQLEGMRRWVNEQLYLIYLSVDRGKKVPAQAELLIAQLAEAALEIANDLVATYLGLKQSPLSILALGKLGMNALPPRSDLDLIFICADMDQLHLANKFSTRLLTALNRPMREGRVWEIDTRLRPSGQSGPPTLCFDSFQNHHLKRAQTWEHLALAHARPVYGGLQDKLSDFCQEVLERPRDQQQCLQDCDRMLGRLRKHRFEQSAPHILSAKLRNGGLMALEYGLSCARLLKCKPEQVQSIQPSLSFWRDLQFMIRLYGLEGQDLRAIPRSIQDRLAALFGTKLEESIVFHNQAVEDFIKSLGLSVAQSQQESQEPDVVVKWLI